MFKGLAMHGKIRIVFEAEIACSLSTVACMRLIWNDITLQDHALIGLQSIKEL